MRAGLLSLVLLVPALGQAQPASPDQLLARAIEEQQKGDLSAAIRDYRALLLARPENVAARVNLGAALADTGQVDAAITEYRAAIKLAPRVGARGRNWPKSASWSRPAPWLSAMTGPRSTIRS